MLYDQGDPDGAISEYRHAIRLDRDLATAHYHLGVALEASGNRKGALKEYRRARDLEPDDSDHRAAYERLSRE